MNVMRFTVVDGRGAVSFVADCDVLLPIVAACQESPRTLEELLGEVARFRPRLRDYVESGLAVFDEHNIRGNYRAIHEAIEFLPPVETPVFRVVDDRTRQASLEAVKAGIVIFNLVDRRIVQVQNTYTEVRRKGKIAVRNGSSRATQIVRYELPPDWAIVP